MELHRGRKPQVIPEMRNLTLNNTESKQVAVLQPQEVTNLDQQFLAQGFHLRREDDKALISNFLR